MLKIKLSYLILSYIIDKFTTVTQNLREQHIKSYLCGVYNINLFKIESLLHCNRIFENMTTLIISSDY